MQPVPADLPDYVKTGAVLADDIDVVAAQAYIPSGSQFLFTPSVEYLVFAEAHQVVYIEPVVATIDATGALLDPQGVPLKLIANVGQDDNTDTWSWSVLPKVAGRQRAKFTLNVTADEDTYLADHMPGPS